MQTCLDSNCIWFLAIASIEAKKSPVKDQRLHYNMVTRMTRFDVDLDMSKMKGGNSDSLGSWELKDDHKAQSLQFGGLLVGRSLG